MQCGGSRTPLEYRLAPVFLVVPGGEASEEGAATAGGADGRSRASSDVGRGT